MPGWRPHSDPAPGEAGEGTKPDPRVCQTERECETDRQASRVSASPSLRASLTRLPRCLSFHPSTPAFSSLSSALVTTPGGHCAPSRLPEHTRAHGPTQIPPNLATISHRISRGDTVSPAQPHRHTPLARPAGRGCGLSGQSLSSRPLLAPSPRGWPVSLKLQGKDRLKGPRLHLRPSRLGGFNSHPPGAHVCWCGVCGSACAPACVPALRGSQAGVQGACVLAWSVVLALKGRA